jgi:tetratricopeptide (TPR) repeat protein
MCIEVKPFLTKAEFIGLGCVEDRIGYHYDSDYSWIQKVKMHSMREIAPHDVLSVCLSKSKEYHQNKEWYLMMINETNDYRLIYGLANLEYNHKNFTEAEVHYRECLDLAPDCDQIYQKMANIYCFKLNKDD